MTPAMEPAGIEQAASGRRRPVLWRDTPVARADSGTLPVSGLV